MLPLPAYSIVFASFVVSSLSLALPLHAATFVVSHLGDDGPGSLRQAILDAEAASGADEINFGPGLDGRIELTTPLPEINESLDILGPVDTSIVIDANQTGRVLAFIPPGSGSQMLLSHLTLTGGFLDGVSGTDDGAGILVGSGDLLFGDRLVIEDNHAPTGFGGAIYGDFGSRVELVVSRVSGNSSRVGGGLFGTEVILSFSSVTRNVTELRGGGINANGEIELFNSTISGNLADSDTSVSFGGGINLDGGSTLTMIHSAVVGNWADVGPGVRFFPGSSVGSVVGSVLAENRFLGTGNLNNCDADLGQLDKGNLEDDDDCGFTGASDFENTPARLALLGSYGAVTELHLPLADSPLVDAAPTGNCPEADQRGVLRPVDGDGSGTSECDIGPVELRPGSETLLFYDGFEDGGTSAWSVAP